MIKNKLIISSIPFSSVSSLSTDALKAESILTQAKAYFESEGFITSDVSYDGTYYTLSIGVPEFNTKIAFKIKPASTSYIYTAIDVDGIVSYYGTGISFKFTNTTYVFGITYFYTENGFGIELVPSSSMDNIGFGYRAYFLCKSDHGGEYVRDGGNGATKLMNCDTRTSISYSVQNNTYDIDTAILSKVLVTDGHLDGVYIISLSEKGQPLSDGAYSGGIIAYLKEYGKFLCLYRSERSFWAVKLDEEETT